MDAARAGDIVTLSRSPELVKSRHQQATALHFAAIHGQIEAARWLLDHGADLEARDGDFHATPLSWANEKGQTAMVAFLLGRGTIVVAGDTGPLHLAAAMGTRVAGLFGPTDPRRNGPYGQLDRCVETFSTTGRMEDIREEVVLKKLEEVLS